MNRFRPSRYYLAAGILLVLLAVPAAWLGYSWAPTLVPAAVLASGGVACLALSLRPTIEVHPHHLRIGARVVPWNEVCCLDWTGWLLPLVVSIRLNNSRRLLLIYPGGLESSRRLLYHLRHAARDAAIDGVPHGEYWRGEEIAAPPPPETAARDNAARYPLLREEDEADVERLYQRLKAVGHMDSKGGDDA